MKNKYSQEYKTSATKMVLEEGRTPTVVAQNLGFSQKQFPDYLS
jgi:hypothetical protein